ncbi:MAG: T9SS type A sorting domain-containing protein [Bacteroidota bacterium]|nr:T9SS type A sorting domain-containing protein [Bacteroidota bacterium]MDP4230544.1 T9SS type A sorting domain-containing protein [Bacteroidota bacterium]MDP4236486.1 T9SS type A sorting domain-containing protein [Bacteroidota bacterium]
MKYSIFLFLMLSFASRVPAQVGDDYFTLRIDNLPGIHSWAYATDPNETGHTTTISDSAAYTFTDGTGRTFMYLHFRRLSQDTVVLFGSAEVVIVFGNQPLSVKSIDFLLNDPNSSCPVENYLFHIENVLLTETTDEFVCQLVGNSIIGHKLVVNRSTCMQDGSLEQSWRDYYRNSGVTDSSLVYFAIPKKNIIQSEVSVAPPVPLHIFPNPTTGLASVRPSSSDRMHMTITNILGESVFEITHTGAAEFTVDLSNVPPGTYFARCESRGTIVTQKIIRNRE